MVCWETCTAHFKHHPFFTSSSRKKPDHRKYKKLNNSLAVTSPVFLSLSDAVYLLKTTTCCVSKYKVCGHNPSFSFAGATHILTPEGFLGDLRSLSSSS